MRRFSANYVYTNTGKPIKNGVVGVDDRGVIVEIIDHKGEEKEYAHTEFRNGIIVPGFVNVLYHNDLSHLKGEIDENLSLSNFARFSTRKYKSKKGPEIEGDSLKTNFFILSPSANPDFENNPPDIHRFLAQGITIAIGSDSYDESKAPSIFEQIKIILNSYPEITFEEVLKWATINSARVLSLDSELGTIETGKASGLNLITPFDFTLQKPKQNSRVVRLV